MADDQKMQELFGSDSEEEAPPAAAPAPETDGPNGDAPAPADDAQLRDLFGSSDDEDVPPSAAVPGPSSAREPSPEDEEAAPKGPPMAVSVAFHPQLAGEHLRLAKLSNIIAIEPRPFDPSTYEPEGIEYTDDRGNKRLRLADANAIRWRWAAAPDGGPPIRESNARLVRWSDGSVTLSVGDEVMDVREIDMKGEHAHLYSRHANLIQGQGPLATKVTLRPASLTSGSHKRLAAAVERHHGSGRTQRVRATATVVDPKQQKEELEKAEEARIKELEKMAEKQQKTMRKYAPAPRRPAPALNAAYLEEEEEEDEEDDGFIVKDDEVEGMEGMVGGFDGDEEEEEEGEEGGSEGEEADLARPEAGDDEEEEAGARRLAAAKTAPPPAPPAPALADSDDERAEPVAKKKRTVLMESDSE